MRSILVPPLHGRRQAATSASASRRARVLARSVRAGASVLAISALVGLAPVQSALAQTPSQSPAAQPVVAPTAPQPTDPQTTAPEPTDPLLTLLTDVDALLRQTPSLTVGRSERQPDGTLGLGSVMLRWEDPQRPARSLVVTVEAIDVKPGSGAAASRLDLALRNAALRGTAAGQPVSIAIARADFRGLTGFRLDAALPGAPISRHPGVDIGWSEARIEGLAAEAVGMTVGARTVATSGVVRRVVQSLVAEALTHRTPDGTQTGIDRVTLQGFDVDLLQRLADGAPVPVDRAKSGVLVAKAEIEGVEQEIGDSSTRLDRIRLNALAHKPRLSGDAGAASLADRLNIPVRFRDLALESADLATMTFKGSVGTIVASDMALKGLAYTGFDSLAVARVVVDEPGTKLTLERFQADDVDFGNSTEPAGDGQILYSGFKVEKLVVGRLASEGPTGPGFDLADADLSMRYPVGNFPTIFRASVGRLSLWPTLLPEGLRSVLTASGRDALTASATLNLSWQDVQEEISIDGTEVRVDGFGDLAIGAVLTGIPRGLLEDYAGMVGEVRPGLRNLSLLYTDKGLTAAIIDSIAADAGLDSRTLKERIISTVPFVFESIPDKITRSRFAFALASFINNPSTLRLMSGRSEPVALEAIRDKLETAPQDLPDLLRLELTAQ